MSAGKPQVKASPEEVAPLDLAKALEMISALSKKQEELEAKLVEKDQTLKTTQAELNELTKNQEGWLITCPNTMYDGMTAGIKFNSGIAFLPSTATYPQLGGKGQGGKVFTPDAAQAAKYLQDDFGYEIEYFSYEDLKALGGRMDERKVARKAAENAQNIQQEEMLRQASKPSRFGV